MDIVGKAWVPDECQGVEPDRLCKGEGEGPAQMRTNQRVRHCVGVRGLRDGRDE